MQSDELREVAEPFSAVPGPTAESLDPVLEVFKRDIDFTLVEKNLRLSTEEKKNWRNLIPKEPKDWLGGGDRIGVRTRKRDC